MAVTFMNERTQAFFDNDTDFPNMIAQDNYNIDPVLHMKFREWLMPISISRKVLD